jgi:hypothetical protein
MHSADVKSERDRIGSKQQKGALLARPSAEVRYGET